MDVPLVEETIAGISLETVNNDVQDKENVCGTILDDALVNSIRQQCEFYFSDANILKDQFMLNQVKSSTDGWVKLELIEKFKKMQKLTQDHEAVIRAISRSDKLELSSDGCFVRRRDPLPEWDPSVYHRSIIITDLPEGTTIDCSGITALFSAEVTNPLLVRIFVPGRKISSDLKRSQVLHPQLGTKLCAVVEFPSTSLASKAIRTARKKWPDAYVHLLSYGSKKPADSNSKRNTKKKETTDPSPPPRRPFLMNLKCQDDLAKVVHVREPVAPPTDDAAGFPSSWRDILRLERLSLSKLISPSKPITTTTTITDPVNPLVPIDSAIVSITPHGCPPVNISPI